MPEGEDKIDKFMEADMILGGGSALLVDGFCALIDLTVAGALVTPLVQGATTLGFSLWLWQKGDKRAFGLGRQIAKQASNLLPFVPTLTAVFIIDVIIHNNPKLKGVAGVVSGDVKTAVKTLKNK